MSLEAILFSLAVLLELFVILMDIAICRYTRRRLNRYEAQITIINMRLALFKERLDILQYESNKKKKEE